MYSYEAAHKRKTDLQLKQVIRVPSEPFFSFVCQTQIRDNVFLAAGGTPKIQQSLQAEEHTTPFFSEVTFAQAGPTQIAPKKR